MIQTISMRQLEEYLDRGGEFTLLDVRDPGAFLAGHLEGAVNIPLEEALDLGWEILAECFEPNETGLKTSLIKERWPRKDALE